MLHPGPCSSVGMRWGTDRQTHRRPWPIHITQNVIIPLSVSMVLLSWPQPLWVYYRFITLRTAISAPGHQPSNQVSQLGLTCVRV